MLNNLIATIEGVHGSLAPLVLHASSVTEVPSGLCPTHAEWVDLSGEGKSFSAKHRIRKHRSEFEMMTFLRRFALVGSLTLMPDVWLNVGCWLSVWIHPSQTLWVPCLIATSQKQFWGSGIFSFLTKHYSQKQYKAILNQYFFNTIPIQKAI